MMSEQAMQQAFVFLLVQKGARIQLLSKGVERGIAGTIPEVYAIDRPVLITKEEIEPMIYVMADDRLVDRRIEREEVLKTWVIFQVRPEVFSDADPVWPVPGNFADFSRGNGVR